MRLMTLLGEIQVEEKDMIDFPSGIPGFDHLRKFVISQPEAVKPFAFLQSVEEKDLSFIVADPFEFYPGYEFTLAEADQQFLEVSGRRGGILYRNCQNFAGRSDHESACSRGDQHLQAYRQANCAARHRI